MVCAGRWLAVAGGGTDASRAGQLGKWEQAAEDYTEALALSPSNIRCLLNRAAAYLWGSDEPEQALPDLQRLLAMGTGPDPGLRCAIALCEARLGMTAEAIARYDEVLTIDPTFVLAYIGRGNVRLGMEGREAAALARRDYQKAMHLQVCPQSLRLQLHTDSRGSCTQIVTHAGGAAVSSEFTAPLHLDGADRLQLRLQIAYSCAIASQPTLASARINLGLHAAAAGKNWPAWRLFYTGLALEPGNTTALEGRAIANAALGRMLGAHLDISAATALEPSSARLLTTAGLIAEIAGDRPAAAARYRDAKQRDPKNARARFNLVRLGNGCALSLLFSLLQLDASPPCTSVHFVRSKIAPFLCDRRGRCTTRPVRPTQRSSSTRPRWRARAAAGRRTPRCSTGASRWWRRARLSTASPISLRCW